NTVTTARKQRTEDRGQRTENRRRKTQTYGNFIATAAATACQRRLRPERAYLGRALPRQRFARRLPPFPRPPHPAADHLAGQTRRLARARRARQGSGQLP